jgi:hypothetical protein
MSSTLRPYATVGIAVVAAGVVAVTPVAPLAVQVGAVQLASSDIADAPGPVTIGLVMGGSGIPVVNFNIPDYVQNADALYIHPNFPETSYPRPYADGLFSTELSLLTMPLSVNYPANTGTGVLAGFPPVGTSMGQDMIALLNAIGSNQSTGAASTVFGYSQSATVAHLVQQQLDPGGTPRPDDGLQFVLVGDPSAPNGGLLERFDGLNLPSLGLAFDGAGPAGLYPTAIYTLEYDGFADFPRYPINFLSDLNALLGTITLHGAYLSLTQEQVANATLLPGSALLGTPDSLTDYYLIDATPPLVSLLQSIPLVGKPLADLLGPDLTYLINLGYGDGSVGYSTPANVPTGIGLFPDVSPQDVFDNLLKGTQQGFAAFADDLSHPASLLVPAPSSFMTDLVNGLSSAVVSPSLTDHVDGLSLALAVGPTLAMQTADIAIAALTSMPGYDITLFLNNLANPIDAVGLPVAAAVGLLTMAAGFEVELVLGATTALINSLGTAF